MSGVAGPLDVGQPGARDTRATSNRRSMRRTTSWSFSTCRRVVLCAYAGRERGARGHLLSDHGPRRP